MTTPTTPQLPQFPQQLPKTQAEWDRVFNVMQQWKRFVQQEFSSGGTVTSVGVSSANAAITVGGTPITGAGTISLTANDFTATQPGIVPASGGGTSNFMRADGSWAAPVSVTYSAGTGLTLTGTSFSINANVYRSNLGSGNVTISTSAPSGGSDGDLWFQY